MTGQAHGIRPWKTQRHLPEADVTAWEIDTAGALDSKGDPLPRLRRQVTGSKAKAIAQRRSLLVDLERGRLEPPAMPVEAVAGTPALSALAPKTVPGGEPEAADNGITLRDFVRGEYQAWSKAKHKLTTHKNRMKHLEGYILPTLGGLTMKEVNKPRSVTKLKERLDANPNLALSSKQQVLLALSAVLTVAADPNALPDAVPLIDQRIKFVYYRDDTPQKGMSVFDEQGNRVGFHRSKRLSDGDWREVVDACEDDFELVLVGLGLWLGCRISECGARTWADANLSVPELFIWSAVCPHTNEITTLKADNQGWVRIPQRMLDALERLKKAARHDYILGVDKFGRPLDRDSIEHRYHLIVDRTAVKKKKYHALRHTFCCRLADAGVQPHEIQRLARHSEMETTFGYIMPSRANLMRATEMFDVD